MPLPGTPHCAKISLGYTNFHEGNQCESVFYLEDTTDAIFVDPTAECNAMFAAAVAQLIGQLSPFVILNSVGFEDVRTVPFGGLVVPQSPTAGTDAAGGIQLPASASLAIKKSTGALGRSGRGRWYWPIGSGGFLVDGNTVLSAAAVNWAAALQSFQNAVEASTHLPKMGIVSYFSGGAMRSSGLFQQITSWGASDLRVDSQRRRLSGRGS